MNKKTRKRTRPLKNTTQRRGGMFRSFSKRMIEEVLGTDMNPVRGADSLKNIKTKIEEAYEKGMNEARRKEIATRRRVPNPDFKPIGDYSDEDRLIIHSSSSDDEDDRATPLIPKIKLTPLPPITTTKPPPSSSSSSSKSKPRLILTPPLTPHDLEIDVDDLDDELRQLHLSDESPKTPETQKQSRPSRPVFISPRKTPVGMFYTPSPSKLPSRRLGIMKTPKKTPKKTPDSGKRKTRKSP